MKRFLLLVGVPAPAGAEPATKPATKAATKKAKYYFKVVEVKSASAGWAVRLRAAAYRSAGLDMPPRYAVGARTIRWPGHKWS